MNNYVIFTDSSADLPVQLTKEMGIKVLSLEVIINKGTPIKNHEVDLRAFYKKLRDKVPVTTSAASIDRFVEFMEPYLEAGRDLLYLGFLPYFL